MLLESCDYPLCGSGTHLRGEAAIFTERSRCKMSPLLENFTLAENAESPLKCIYHFTLVYIQSLGMILSVSIYWGVAGLLKLGLRSTFTHISEQLQRFVELVNM